MDLTTPAVLFPAISLLLLAYTNRFLGLAALIRSLHDRYQEEPDSLIAAQIGNLRYRVLLIRKCNWQNLVAQFREEPNLVWLADAVHEKYGF